MLSIISKTLKDRLIYGLLIMSVSVSVITTLAVVVLLGKETGSFFQEVPVFDFLFGTVWTPLLDPHSFGVLPLLAGTGMIVVGAIAIALPIGILVATFLSEFSSHKMRSYIKPVLEILAGIPTIVYGYFALTVVTPSLKWMFDSTEVFNAASGAIVVGIMIFPMVASLCDDGFRDIPQTLREGAYALGATPFEVITQILIPASLTRISAAIILAVSRAVGETMAVTLAAGATPNLTINPLESIQTMTAYIVQVSMGDTPAGGVEYLTCFAVGTLLFIVTLLLNIAGFHIINKVSWERS